MAAKERWSLRNIYLYLVCFVTLIMVIVAVVGVVRNVAELIYPDPGGYSERIPFPPEDEDEIDPEILEEERELARDSERRWTILSLVGNVAMLFVAGPVYLYHWRKIETEPDVASTESSAPGTPTA